ncbi:MAG: hypothetical protein A2864_00285 [Candidatus Woykebacteria bacterium RIFCSPHIGHO2_01_FULL_39_12]|uniref:Uncharacterized protein n=1 Tax=Candidatus Woykebacteria bacterium RIFCSPHIGHO2_01_FULL_39_12 TaxID=1802599 RepID=A0A1G1WJU1_9BACT|nr:MAG: hypothetical protein A2864_00285 [Candidatus Woykebacteria bacterium RIFCSPHIGHO2_01_FULL_39_12]
MMSKPTKFITIDVGNGWTKGFVLEISKEDNLRLLISKKTSLPTSVGDLNLTVNQILDSLDAKRDNDTALVITSSLENAKSLAEKLGANFALSEVAKEHFLVWLDGKASLSQGTILDAGATSFSASYEASEVGKFILHKTTAVEIENYFGNKKIRPHKIAQSPNEVDLEEAFFRLAASRKTLNFATKGSKSIVLTGAIFSYTPKLTRTALIILDTLQSGVTTQVLIDTELFLDGFGALLAAHPSLDKMNCDFLQNLGGFVSLGGSGTLKLDYGFSQVQEISVNQEEIAIVPAKSDQLVEVSIDGTKEADKVWGGSFGILIDGRVKPLNLSFGNEESRQKITSWYNSLEKTEFI